MNVISGIYVITAHYKTSKIALSTYDLHINCFGIRNNLFSSVQLCYGASKSYTSVVLNALYILI